MFNNIKYLHVCQSVQICLKNATYNSILKKRGPTVFYEDEWIRMIIITLFKQQLHLNKVKVAFWK